MIAKVRPQKVTQILLDSQAADISIRTTTWESGYPATWTTRQENEVGTGRALGSTTGSSSYQVLSSLVSGHMRETSLEGLSSHSQSLASSNNGMHSENSLLVYSINEWTSQSIFIPTNTTMMSWSSRISWIHHQTCSLSQTEKTFSEWLSWRLWLKTPQLSTVNAQSLESSDNKIFIVLSHSGLKFSVNSK